jgi:hypothetical protein
MTTLFIHPKGFNVGSAPSSPSHSANATPTRSLRIETPENRYPNITIKYAVLVKQFLTQIAFAKLHLLAVQQTTDALLFMVRSPTPTDRTEPEKGETNNHIRRQEEPDREVFESMYRKILMEHVEAQTCEIWDEVFAEHNVAIVLEYYINIYTHLLTNRDNDTSYVYSPSVVQKHLDIRRARVYTPETYAEYIHAFAYEDDNDTTRPNSLAGIYDKYKIREQEKYIRNSVIYDVLVYIVNMYGWRDTPLSGVATPETPRLTPAIEIYAATLHRLHSAFDPNPFYVYLEKFAKRAMQHGVSIVNKQGHLEITESVMEKYTNLVRNDAGAKIGGCAVDSELYTIWLLSLWLSPDA